MKFSTVEKLIEGANSFEKQIDMSESIEFSALEASVDPPDSGMLGSVSIFAEPDWEIVAENSVELLRKSKNMWVAVFLSYSLAKTSGFLGLDKGLKLIKAYLESSWDSIYPLPDAEDGDCSERQNALSLLSPAPGSKYGIIDFNDLIIALPISNSKQLGSFSYKQYKQSFNKTDSLSEISNSTSSAVIEASLKDSQPAFISSIIEMLLQIKAVLGEIEDIFNSKSPNNNHLNYSRIISLLNDILSFIKQFGNVHADEIIQVADIADECNEVNTVISSKCGNISIRCKDDAVKVLNEVCKYLEKNEPSSPVPYLIHKALKLLPMNFSDIMSDLCPDALRQIDWLIPSEKK